MAEIRLVDIQISNKGGDDFAIDDICLFALNQPPVAICQDMLVAVGPDGYVDASVDGGSYDPDGDIIGFSQDPAGPYGVGVYNVELTVADPQGASDSCFRLA